MTTWTTFETIDETERFTEVFIDRLGVHSYIKDERTRFKLERTFHPSGQDFGKVLWIAYDYEAEEDEMGATTGTMRECVQWVAGRVLYGA